MRDAANEPDYGAIEVPHSPVTDEEIAALPVLDPKLLDPAAAKRDPLPGRYNDGHYDTCAIRAGGPCDCPANEQAAAPVREYGVGLCAHTDFECDCDCACPKYDGVSSHPDDYCSWPDCACGCLPECKGCAMTQEAS